MKSDVLVYFDLITNLKTTQEVANLTCEIDAFMLTFFESEKISLEKALDLISTGWAEKIRQAFSKNNFDINDRDAVARFFKNLKELMEKLKVIKLVLAFDPTRKTIEKIHNFVKDNIGIDYILDIEISEDVLGGAVVIFDGKYCDFTLKKSIENTFNRRVAEEEGLPTARI